MSEIKVNKISTATGTDLDLGDSGDSIKVPSGGFLKVNNIDVVAVAPSTSGKVLTSDGTNWTSADAAGGGKLLKVWYVEKTDTFSTTSATPVNITGFVLTTDTLTTGSKVLITVNVACGNNTIQRATSITLWSGATQLFLGDSGTGNRTSMTFKVSNVYEQQQGSFTFLHAPGVTTAQTYQVKLNTETSRIGWINRPASWDANVGLTPCSITAMEIGV